MFPSDRFNFCRGSLLPTCCACTAAETSEAAPQRLASRSPHTCRDCKTVSQGLRYLLLLASASSKASYFSHTNLNRPRVTSRLRLHQGLASYCCSKKLSLSECGRPQQSSRVPRRSWSAQNASPQSIVGTAHKCTNSLYIRLTGVRAGLSRSSVCEQLRCVKTVALARTWQRSHWGVYSMQLRMPFVIKHASTQAIV